MMLNFISSERTVTSTVTQCMDLRMTGKDLLSMIEIIRKEMLLITESKISLLSDQTLHLKIKNEINIL